MKILKGFITFAILLGAYAFFQRNINMPVYDYFISRHVATYKHMNTFGERNSVDYIIIGDSTGLHTIQPTKLKVTADNLCLSGASTQDSYYALIRLDLTKVKKGIILASSFYAASHYDKHLWERFISTGFYSWSDLFEIYNESMLTHTYPSSEMSYFSYLWRIATSKLFLYPEAVKSFFQFPYNFVKKNKMTLYLNRQSEGELGFIPHPKNFHLSPEQFIEPYNDFYSKPFVINETDSYYLNKIVNYSKTKNLKLYILSPILADRALGKDVSKFINGFHAFFNSLAAKEPTVKYVIMPTSDHAADFFDFNHLSKIGADNLASKISFVLDKLN